MDNRMLIPLTILCVIGLFILLLIQFFPSHMFAGKSSASYIRNVDVRGTAINHKGMLYTLNFEQQGQVLKYLNQSIPAAKTDYQNATEPLPFSKIIIYTFDGRDVEINPIAFHNENLVFFSPSWHQGAYLIELSGGELKRLLSQTYDPS